MDFNHLNKYKSLILRGFLGITVLFWGYEKLTLGKLVQSYTMDYEKFMFFDVNTFLTIAGCLQIAIALMLVSGLFTRPNAFLVALMGIVTIIIPGFIIIKNVPHFAYAFALTGAALTLTIEGSGEFSLDKIRSRKSSNRLLEEENESADKKFKF
jgi:uncharacterized membrane protein YphA (DoxX/SURF4 family)